jgi:8-oxo-dGTP pyrophosphatase MutT (NUDIX family)
VVAVVRRGETLLVIERSQYVVAPGAYCFPGGGMEEGEAEVEALVREMREELNVAVTPIRRVWESVTPWQVELAWWLVTLPDDAELQPTPEEVASIHWHTTNELALLPGLLESNHAFLAALARGEIVLD